MRLITLAIHTYDHAIELRQKLEAEGIAVTLQNVNLEHPEVSSGVRIRIAEHDLPLALRIVENPEVFDSVRQGRAAAERAVLLPTDFSEHSYRAARAAVRVAAMKKAPLVLLHSYIDPRLSGSVQLTDKLTYDLADTAATQRILEEVDSQMAAFSARLKDEMLRTDLPAVRIDCEVVEGVPEESIMRYAKANRPVLVVMGTRSAQRKERDMIGSVTAEVLDEGRFTVLSIPENIEIFLPDKKLNVLFFGNLDQEDILAMDTLYRYFPDVQAEVTIVHIPARQRFTDRDAGSSAVALSEYCTKTFDKFRFKAVPLSPKKALAELRTADRAFDLIVIPSRRKSAFARLFSPGLAHSIITSADIPMLVIPV